MKASVLKYFIFSGKISKPLILTHICHKGFLQYRGTSMIPTVQLRKVGHSVFQWHSMSMQKIHAEQKKHGGLNTQVIACGLFPSMTLYSSFHFM